MGIPASVQVVLREESLIQIHLTIPSSEALADADLELVSRAGMWGDFEEEITSALRLNAACARRSKFAPSTRGAMR